MRKYTGLMVVVLVLLAAGLILTMGDFRPNTGKRAKVTEVYGTAIDAQEYRKIGNNSINAIKQANDPQLSSYALDLIHNRRINPYAAYGFSRTGSSNEEIRNFVNRRVVVAKTAADYGIYPSTELATKHIRERIFANEGEFDAPRYQEFLKNLGSSGIQEADFVKLVAESLAYEKLKSLVSSGLQSPNQLTDRAIKFNQQTLNFTTIDISIDPYKAAINPTEEEINTYWKENDFNYLTERKISISYIAESPVYETPKPVAPVRTPETKEEDFKKLSEEYTKLLAAWEIDVQKKATTLVDSKIDDLCYLIDDSEGLRFEEEIQAAGLKLTKTELFSSKDIPAELKELKTKNGQSIADILFEIKIADSLQYRIPAPIKLASNGWFYVRFDKEAKPQPMTYEQAKELAKADIIQEQAHAAMLAEVEAVKEKLTQSIASGSTPTEAAKANELTALKRTDVIYGQLAKDERGQVSISEHQAFENASITEMNSFAENNVESDDKVTLVFLEKRHVVNSSEAVETRLRVQKARSEMLQDSVFRAWMDDAVTKANIPPISFN